MVGNQSFQDSVLVRRLGKGDAAAFSEIYTLYAEKLVTWAYNILKDKDVCRDLVHDIFLSLWMKRQTLDIESLQGYLYTATRYQVLQVIRKDKVREGVFDKIELRVWGEPVAESLVYQKELQQKLMEVVKVLPEKAQEVYRLSREHHLSNKEIAERLSVSVKTVENHLTAALKKIRAGMGDFLLLILLFINND